MILIISFLCPFSLHFVSSNSYHCLSVFSFVCWSCTIVDLNIEHLIFFQQSKSISSPSQFNFSILISKKIFSSNILSSIFFYFPVASFIHIDGFLYDCSISKSSSISIQCMVITLCKQKHNLTIQYISSTWFKCKWVCKNYNFCQNHITTHSPFLQTDFCHFANFVNRCQLKRYCSDILAEWMIGFINQNIICKLFTIYFKFKIHIHICHTSN